MSRIANRLLEMSWIANESPNNANTKRGEEEVETITRDEDIGHGSNNANMNQNKKSANIKGTTINRSRITLKGSKNK